MKTTEDQNRVNLPSIIELMIVLIYVSVLIVFVLENS